MKGLTMLERKMNSNEDILNTLSLDVKSCNMATSALKLDFCKETDRISDLHQSTNTFFSKADSSFAQSEKNFKVVYTLLSSHLVKLEQSKDLFQAGLEKRKENVMQFETMKESLCKLQWKTINLNIQIDVILAGDDGVGKTSTGNSIVGRSRFGRSHISDQTKIFEVFSTKIDDVKLTVTDPLPKSYQHSIMRKADPQFKRSYDPLFRVIEGNTFHVLIYLVRFGSENDASLYEEIKKNYKGKLFYNNCIIVMCGGDEFYKQNPSLKFESWCERQTGIFANMYKDCNKRAVLFDNETDSAGNMKEQQTKLLKAILQLPNQGKTFKIIDTDWPFNKCAQQ
ncbi:uncharacterized protein LOC131943565 [Physella acuta]|uniref:uncharacterized protein LOC131943565 n=1 Tax=Physella acuta TaxID=109671 RepID=UPI0027DCB295|nr:uncharacterized protein LOC131943565 [Physella acuta]